MYKNKIENFKIIHGNIVRMNIDVMKNVVDQPTPYYGYEYIVDGETYYVKEETVQKFITLLKYAETEKTIWLFPILGGTGTYDTNEENIFPKKAASMVHAITLESLKDNIKTYERIIAYEIENEMNHEIINEETAEDILLVSQLGHHTGWKRADEITLLSEGSKKVHSAEIDAFNELKNSDQLIQMYNNDRDIVVNYHLDLEYIKTGFSISGATTRMCNYIKDILKNNGIIDIVGLDFYPDWDRGWSQASHATLFEVLTDLGSTFGPESEFRERNIRIVIAETGLSEKNNFGVSDQTAQKD